MPTAGLPSSSAFLGWREPPLSTPPTLSLQPFGQIWSLHSDSSRGSDVSLLLTLALRNELWSLKPPCVFYCPFLWLWRSFLSKWPVWVLGHLLRVSPGSNKTGKGIWREKSCCRLLGRNWKCRRNTKASNNKGTTCTGWEMLHLHAYRSSLQSTWGTQPRWELSAQGLTHRGTFWPRWCAALLHKTEGSDSSAFISVVS